MVQPPVFGPLASQIMAEQQAVESLGEQVKDAQSQVENLRELRDAAERTAEAAEEALERAEKRVDRAAAEAYREQAEVPEPILEFADGLQHLAPGLRGATVTGKAAGDSYLAAVELAETASESLEAAETAYQEASSHLAELQAQFAHRSRALATLQAENAELLRRAQEEADRYANSIDFDPGSAVNGLLPHPKAIAAVRYALAQVGKPYVWGDEGPDTFDCSGLVYAAYRHAGVPMTARTARQQYYSTTKVAPGHMLPGDLVFFGPDKSNPESIHHVGIYIGDGKIVHAPRPGDVVRIAPIWWWEFFGATRVVPAVKAPQPKPTPTPDPTWTPKPNPTTPSPDPTTPSPDPTTPSPDPTSPSPDPDPTGSPVPTPTGSQTPGESPGATASPDRSGAVCPSLSPSGSPSTSPSPTPTPSPSVSESPSQQECEAAPAADSEADTTVQTTDVSYRTAGGAEFALLLLAPYQKAITLLSRRPTRTGTPVAVRSRRGRRLPDPR